MVNSTKSLTRSADGKSLAPEGWLLGKAFSIITFLFVLSGLSINAQTTAWLWADAAGGADPDAGIRVAPDANGNVYVTGMFSSPTITFGTTVLTNAGSYDLFVVKYDASGNVLWAKSAGGTGMEAGACVAIDPNGNVLVTGFFDSPSFNFGTTVLSTAGTWDMFIVKFDPAGNILWANSAGGSGTDEASAITIDPGGNILITGSFVSTTINFGTTVLTRVGFSDMYVAKYDAAGNVLWANSAGGNGSNAGGNGVVSDAIGNVIVTGHFDSTSIAFGANVLTAAGSYDMYIVKYDVSGNLLWANSAGGTIDEYGISVTTDAIGNIFATCTFASPFITFGTVALTNASAFSYYDFAVVKYDASGNVLWAKSTGGIASDNCNGISMDANGNILITGSFESPTIAFGTTVLTNAGDYDIFGVKYDPSGNVLWANAAGGTGMDEGNDIVTDSFGNVYVTGDFASPSLTFGTTVLTNSGYSDIFIAILDNTTGLAEQPSSETINIFPNPGNGQFKIESSKIIDEIKITNVLGQIIYQLNPIDNSHVFQLNTSGIYFIQITSDLQTVTEKLIVSE